MKLLIFKNYVTSDLNTQTNPLTNKGSILGNDMILTENNSIITKEDELLEKFNDHYINIVEKTSGKRPLLIGKEKTMNVSETINIIIQN